MPEFTSILRLKEFLMADELLLNGGSSQANIDEFQRSNGVRIPKDLESYFVELNGTNGIYVIGIIRFWGIEEIQRLSKVIPRASLSDDAIIQSAYSEPIENSNDYFLFADSQYEAQVYAIKLTEAEGLNDVIILTGEKPRILAKSFSEFVELYLNLPERIGVDLN